MFLPFGRLSMLAVNSVAWSGLAGEPGRYCCLDPSARSSTPTALRPAATRTIAPLPTWPASSPPAATPSAPAGPQTTSACTTPVPSSSAIPGQRPNRRLQRHGAPSRSRPDSHRLQRPSPDHQPRRNSASSPTGPPPRPRPRTRPRPTRLGIGCVAPGFPRHQPVELMAVLRSDWLLPT